MVLETKGEHLGRNDDTEYKRAVMAFLSKNFNWDAATSIGELSLNNEGQMVFCDLVLFEDYTEKLPIYFPHPPLNN